GGFDTMPDLEDISVFGGAQTIGNDFEGQYYNLNRDRSGRSIPMDSYGLAAVLRKFVRSGWNRSKLAKYYRSPKKLYTTHFIMPIVPSPMAPDAFGEPEKESYLFFLLYKGQLVCPASRPEGITFRFRGSGDAYLFVRVDGKNVLTATWQYVSYLASSFDWWRSSSPDNRKHRIGNQRAAVGDWITLEPGESVEMEVLFGENQGDSMGVWLCVEVEGEEYNERGWQGSNPIFPAFKTEAFSRDQIDEIRKYLFEGDVGLTNGPVFRDYDVGTAVADTNTAAEPPEAVVSEPVKGGMRTWTMEDGRTFDAGFVTVIGTKAVFKSARGKVKKIAVEQLSAEDREYMELESPPDLKFSFSKQSIKRDYPETYAPNYERTLPDTYYYDFSMTTKQTSPGDYVHELRAELFTVGYDVGGNDYVLLDRREAVFSLTEENQRTFRFGAKRVELTRYLTGTPQRGIQQRGVKYASWLLVVKDKRGRIIAHETPKKWLFENLEDLRKLSVGNYFDKTCTRVYPSSPKPFYNEYDQ
ncbi:MAG: hypothetical protein ABFR47_09365, partial [Verrucomicrobiota bacterium]